MATKAEVIAAIQEYVFNTYPTALDLRISLDNPTRGPIVVRGETEQLGVAYMTPGFLDAVLQGLVDKLTTIYGQNYQFAKSLPRVTNATASFVSALQLVTPALTDTYLVSWRAVVDSLLNAGQVRLYNVTDNAVVGSLLQYSAIGENLPVFGSGDIVFSGAAKTFQIQHRDMFGTGGVQGIQDLRLEIKRIA